MGHYQQVIIVKNYNVITLQVEICNLTFEKLKFGQDIGCEKQTSGSKVIDLPLCINDP
jgi:hypothetical protein